MDVITPGAAGYTELQHAWARPGAPAVILRPRSTAGVSRAIERAVSQGGPISVRSGGHGIAIPSTNDDGTVIDLGHFDTIERLDDRTVRIGAGARWGTVAATLAEWGLAVSAGDLADVGVGGLAVTGGLGLLSRSHGLTIDHVEEILTVTADGQHRHVNAVTEPDLFWAMRGAGSFFGVGTAFDIKATPLTDVIAGNLTFTPANPAAFIAEWASLVDAAPRELSAFLYLLPGPTVTAKTTIVWSNGDEDAGRAAIKPFLLLPAVVQTHIRKTPYPDVLAPSDGPHAGAARFRTRSGLVNVLDQEAAGPLAELVTDGVGVVQVRSARGAVNDVAADATAYAHRHQTFSIVAITANPTSPLDSAWAPIADRSDGIYSAFETPGAAGWLERTYPGRTLQRLRHLQRQWDPERVFSSLLDS